jgi:hypothetical protein
MTWRAKDICGGPKAGFAQLNPLYMKYTPGPSGHFAGQQGYGYRSIEEFVMAAEEVNGGGATAAEISARGVLATVDTTARVTAMLEARPKSRARRPLSTCVLSPSST